ncbi:glycosyltransferase 61 family protein [Roseinatronobacter monicus]|uniref:Uncharacterized protein DUF563 n=1 Tax=Roseinatronobacter monicus TaxID=393481 RepID=A0A543KDL1_9RHOB|nr:glycosyltransferase family 61 protein [Roseinatronobacter monicus]TQM93171.1 uncharacterized protein DUF563 [Roseinatronobacter monicus]
MTTDSASSRGPNGALDRLPPVQTFQNVLVSPAANRDSPGAAWPQFDTQVHARLFRRGRLVCKTPALDVAPEEIREDPVIFASVYEDHFGHLTAETVPRLPQSLAEHGDLPIIFTRMKSDTSNARSRMFRSVMDWLHIPEDQIEIIEKPTLFREVHVAAQGEHLDGPKTPPDYLELLEHRIAANLRPRTPRGVAFVTRAGLEHKMGAHAAERYLVSCLRELGVRIVYPEVLTLREQMRIYARAKHLVFSEGSAVHGRQLLGRIDQTISVLRRRRQSNMARGQMGPRCAALTYVPCFGGALHVTNRYGAKLHYAMKSFYQIDALHAYFAELGIGLAQIWSQDKYRQIRDQDVLNWVFAMYDPHIEPWLSPANDDAYLLDQFGPLYLGHIRDQAAAIIKARKVAQR